MMEKKGKILSSFVLDFFCRCIVSLNHYSPRNKGVCYVKITKNRREKVKG
jgi:hypothetical protein